MLCACAGVHAIDAGRNENLQAQFAMSELPISDFHWRPFSLVVRMKVLSTFQTTGPENEVDGTLRLLLAAK